MSTADDARPAPQAAPGPAHRTLRPAELVEELATTKQRCAALQGLFAYRKRLLDGRPLWFTQVITGGILDPDAEPARLTAHTLFIGMSRAADEWRRTYPDIFVPASVRSRFGLEGEILLAREPSEIFACARDIALRAPFAIEVPLNTEKEEGVARAVLEARRVETRKGRVAQKVIATSAPVSPSPATSLPAARTDDAPPPPAARVSEAPAEADDAQPEPAERPLIAYDLGTKLPIHLRPGPHERDWIEASPARFAARCLPLLIANQSGWELVFDGDITVTWNGKAGLGAMKIEGSPDMQRVASSHFGRGILTFSIPFLFRTTSGYNLLVRGPANRPKAGAAPLEGVIETDWTAATFTMNWQITEVDRPIRFAPGEVIAMVVPQRRHELERFVPRLVPILDDPEMARRHELFAQSRDGFLKDLETAPKTTEAETWQRSYFQGRDPDGTVAPDHQTRRKLLPFV